MNKKQEKVFDDIGKFARFADDAVKELLAETDNFSLDYWLQWDSPEVEEAAAESEMFLNTVISNCESLLKRAGKLRTRLHNAV